MTILSKLEAELADPRIKGFNIEEFEKGSTTRFSSIISKSFEWIIVDQSECSNGHDPFKTFSIKSFKIAGHKCVGEELASYLMEVRDEKVDCKECDKVVDVVICKRIIQSPPVLLLEFSHVKD